MNDRAAMFPQLLECDIMEDASNDDGEEESADFENGKLTALGRHVFDIGDNDGGHAS